ncbi:MAG: VapC toxin family PIN domain ribonuclease [Flexibacter sp. CG_4_10_14_3_um_filter_32_15]|nr:MAG: VapC toxin family PIN domain ribonuclease [Flexibacter sp. CG_4_10_14_3_um_filter_32_15]
MVKDRIVLDTNVVSAILKGNAEIVDKLENYTPCLPVIVCGELLFGANNSSRVAQNIEIITNFINATEILAVTYEVAEKYALVRNQLKKIGRPIPENDIWIAATCLTYQLPVATFDKHFGYVEGINLFL